MAERAKMDEFMENVYEHIKTAEMMLRARHKVLSDKENLTKVEMMDVKRVGGLIRVVSRSRRDMVYWYAPHLIQQGELMSHLEGDYYDA